MHKFLITLLFLSSVFTSFANAEPVYIHVNDMSLVKYQATKDNKIYFRNLSQFNSDVTGCCYAFYLDISTDFGKAAWSTMLMKMASKQDLYLYVTESRPPRQGAPAQIIQIGNW
ncbi:conserved exported hypothetical protein [Vibrio chagasii]|nr:conserved exported hypothetical protein [Vibrio chagasii]